jgi:hypothetical protein
MRCHWAGRWFDDGAEVDHAGHDGDGSDGHEAGQHDRSSSRHQHLFGVLVLAASPIASMFRAITLSQR